jgi:hypothetical protein
MIKRSLLTSVIACLFVSCWVDSTPAQQFDWQQVGLERAWKFQAPTDPARSGDLSAATFVSSERKRTVYEVSYEGGPKSVFVSGQIDRSGNRLDAAAAAFQADVELRTMKALGHDDAKIESREVPDVSLLVQTGSGQLLLLDGETGQLRWDITVGKHNLTNQKPAIGERYVAAVNGSTLYVINKETGKLEQTRALTGIPDAGPTIAGEKLFVPTMGRPFEVYSLLDGELHLPAKFRASYGRITSPPVATPLSVTWATDRGFLFMADPITGVSTARVESRRGIVGAPAFIPPDWVVVSIEDGYVLAVELQRQVIQWEFFTGQSLSESPFAMSSTVYVPSAQDELFALNVEDGKLKWNASDVSRVISGMDDRLYCVDSKGQLSILDVADGRKVAGAPIGPKDLVLTNGLTDRIYIVRHTGMIECVRADGAQWPTLHFPLAASDTADDKPAMKAAEEETASPGDEGSELTAAEVDDVMASDEDENPFGTDDEANPFGEDEAEEMGADDGFDDENPFDVGDDEDPFGDTGDDPFG